ncbi:hypothetical protein ABZS66_35500 [Dactylosporangium sp. NPDC005572]|uniref:hypothetical protein n=1 Tax=Dactylosporangium sp. NPDC005572 TaxID=3156889 RepID=UPI0033A037D9
MRSVASSWELIERWLRRHAPASAAVLAPPAGDGQIGDAAAAMGLVFPDDVVESLRCHDGLTEWANIFPEQPPLSAGAMVGHWQMCMEIAEDVDGFAPSPATGDTTTAATSPMPGRAVPTTSPRPPRHWRAAAACGTGGRT